jgi:hypothetical protein
MVMPPHPVRSPGQPDSSPLESDSLAAAASNRHKLLTTLGSTSSYATTVARTASAMGRFLPGHARMTPSQTLLCSRLSTPKGGPPPPDTCPCCWERQA